MKIIDLETRGPDDVIDVTATVRDYLAQSGIGTGTIQLLCPGATTGVALFTANSPDDPKEYLKKLNHLMPKFDSMMFTGFATPAIKSSLVGKTTMVTVTGGELLLGRGQQILFFDFDGPCPDRKLILTAQGVPLGPDDERGLPAELLALIAAEEEAERLRKEEEERLVQEMREEYAQRQLEKKENEEEDHAQE